MNTQDSQSELTRKQRIDNINVSFLADDIAYLVDGTSWKNLNSDKQNRLLFGIVDLAIKIDDYVTTRVKEALELARSKDPHKCEFGHEVYSHNTVDGWCCACEADQAFMEAEIEARVKEAYDEGYSDGRRKRPTGGNKTYGVGA